MLPDTQPRKSTYAKDTIMLTEQTNEALGVERFKRVEDSQRKHKASRSWRSLDVIVTTI